jgi:DNA-binding NarL/FixJ family response regulator
MRKSANETTVQTNAVQTNAMQAEAWMQSTPHLQDSPQHTHQHNNSKISVLLVDDHAIWRGGVLSMLDDTEFQVVGQAASGKEAIETVRRLNATNALPRLILLDIRMAGGDGLDALQTLKKEYPTISVVMLTTYDNPTYMARAVAGGASGYLLKGLEREEMLHELRIIADGGTLLNAEDFNRSLRGISAEAAQAEDLIHPLSERELEVLRLLSTGLANKEIARLLFISECTVKTHVEHIIGKIGVSDRVQAAVWAARQGLLAEPKKNAPSDIN